MRASADPRPPGPVPPLQVEAARDAALAMHAAAAILVEGWSDEAALEALARRRGRDLRALGVLVVPIGGATNVHRFAHALGPGGLGLRLAGLCDAAELPLVRRGLARAGVDASTFHACTTDLEDELIRALGIAGVERVIETQGELASLRSLQAQPAQRGREPAAQLHRFIGTRAGRKIRYGALLVDALDLDSVPAVLDRVLADAGA